MARRASRALSARSREPLRDMLGRNARILRTQAAWPWDGGCMRGAGQALTDGQQPNSGWLHPAGMARACTRNQTRLSICHVFQKFGINVSKKEKKWSTDLSTTNSNSLEGHRINYRKVSQRKTTRASLLEKKKGERKKFSYSFSSMNLPAVWHKHMWYLQLTNLILPWSWSRAGQ